MTDETVDREIRDAVEPSPATIDRVLAGALRSAPRRTLRVGMALATGATVLVLAVVLTVVRHGSKPIQTAQVRVTNVGDTIVVRRPEGSVWLIGRGSGETGRLAAGTAVAYRPGERR
jgi:hypothetical protein